MKTFKIFFVRCGLTEDNLSGRIVGRADVPLLPEGEQMLLAMREQYIYPAADLYFCPPLERCTRTIELLFSGAEVITVPELNECNLGDFEGKLISELGNDEQYAAWVGGDMESAPPNGESTTEFMTRVCTAFNQTVRKIIEAGAEESVICATGGVISAILAVYGLPQLQMSQWECLNGKGYCAVIDPSIWLRSGGMFEVAGQYPFLKPDEQA